MFQISPQSGEIILLSSKLSSSLTTSPTTLSPSSGTPGGNIMGTVMSSYTPTCSHLAADARGTSTRMRTGLRVRMSVQRAICHCGRGGGDVRVCVGGGGGRKGGGRGLDKVIEISTQVGGGTKESAQVKVSVAPSCLQFYRMRKLLSTFSRAEYKWQHTCMRLLCKTSTTSFLKPHSPPPPSLAPPPP